MRNNLFKSEHKDIPVQEMIERGRAIAERSIDQDINEKKIDVLALEGIEFEYAKRLDNIGRQVEELQNESSELQSKRKANRVRLRLLKQAVHEMEIDLLGDA